MIKRRLPTALVALLALGLLAGAPAQAAPGKVVRQYVKVDDGTQIALCIWEPAGFTSRAVRKWPTLFEMDGYGGCPHVDDNEFWGASSKFVVVYAQIRGTGCSGGQLDLFSRRSSLDGKYIIDRWIRAQRWSNGRIGITGHSYSGLTGFLVAGTHPRVQAVAVSGLIDDFYRSILYPGGIFNEGFPVLWGGLVRPASEYSGNVQNYDSDPQCVANQAQHQGSDTVPAQLIAPVYTQQTATPGSWAIAHSLFAVERGLDAPIQINQQYQDEQTGPRGGYILWQHVPAGLPKRLVLSNGQHNPNDPAADKDAWLTCWLIDRGRHCPRVTGRSASRATVRVPVNSRRARVLMYFDSLIGGPHKQLRPRPYLTSDWPAPETGWRTYYLRADHTLGQSPRGGEGSVSYLSTTTDTHTTATLGSPVGNSPQDNIGQIAFIHSANEARYTLRFPRITAVSGPALLNVWLRSSAPDTDLFVDVLDHDTRTGQMQYLQRGLMRASFRATDSAKSDRIGSGPLRGTIYRPYHDYINRDLMLPLNTYLVPIELFPFGHVFYPGHELVLDVHAPPANDPISTYAYEPLQAPALNMIIQDSSHRSTLLLPSLRTLPPLWSRQPSCDQIAGYVCFKPVGS